MTRCTISPGLPLTEESKEPEDIKVTKAINSIIPGFFLFLKLDQLQLYKSLRVLY